jgi:endonuclease G
MDPEELIRAEMPLEAIRESAESTMTESALAGLEALLENSAEHVVPQSWFKEREPMRGDLHHLFACEKRCNSFRSNIPFFEFTEEKVMEDCGRREALAFEPKGGKGAVARAVLYFLMRYPGEINNRSTEYTPDRIDILLRWHNEFPPDLYEQHRNREIFLKQGNRNPLIDHKEWASRINFRLGLGA